MISVMTETTNETLATAYNPKDYEAKLYEFWVKSGFFKASRDSKKPPYTIIMPPPNVTSQLHMGHGTGYTMQDILIRWKRMKGFEALWMPGTDHAGIATQMMVEKALEKEGKTRQQLGRDEFTKRLWGWKDKYGGMILDQFRKLGFSCDWDRLAFTMDKGPAEAVRKIFVDLYNDGLIYRGERLVNWDPVLKTAISDDEIETKEVNGHLWHIKYPIDGTSETITVATTRPETMLGDTAVAVHPDDERYKHLVGKKVKLPLVGRLIPIIADDYVKSDFGSGVVKITPAHDPNDFEMGKRHKLPMIDVMNPDATINDKAPEQFRGLPRFEARKKVIKELKALELLEKEESYKHSVPHSERSKEVIEPRLSLQWFVDMKKLAAPAAEAARKGELKFHPDMWVKTYLHWLDNIQDWCISRQLWWGHRIPIWYCKKCEKTTTGLSDGKDPTKCGHCGCTEIRQDDDVLDTWFSSWLWPISTFGWPEKTPDLKHFYPTDVLVTAPEIIFLWVARMVMVGLYSEKQLPFKDVFLTATVCDKQGRKFSKTLGNGIDPMDVIDKYGTDAVRFTAVQLAPLGGRIRMSEEDFEAGGRFVNKIWNAARFLMGNIKPGDTVKPLDTAKLDPSGKWLLTQLADAAANVDKNLENYRINDATDAVYHMIWGSFCDWGLETAKVALTGNDAAARQQAISLLVYVLEGILRLASPVMPFVTEEIWGKIPRHPDWDATKSLMVASFPDAAKLKRFPKEAAEWQRVQDLISSIRSARSQAGLPPRTELDAHVRCDAELAPSFNAAAADIQRLAGVAQFKAGADVKNPGQCLVAVGRGYEAYIPAGSLIDVPKERARLEGEKARISKIVAGIDAKLSNPNFADKAPADVVQATRDQRANMASQLDSLARNLESLK
jgi:valyl-tRNA synthetase